MEGRENAKPKCAICCCLDECDIATEIQMHIYSIDLHTRTRVCTVQRAHIENTTVSLSLCTALLFNVQYIRTYIKHQCLHEQRLITTFRSGSI